MFLIRVSKAGFIASLVPLMDVLGYKKVIFSGIK